MSVLKQILSVICLVCLLSSCSDNFQKTKSGLLYKIIPGKGKGSAAKPGSVIKFHVLVKQKDSVTYNSFGKVPAFAMVDSSARSYDITELFPMLKVGDSAVVVQLIDSLVKLQAGQMPPGMKKGDKITFYVKVLDIMNDINTAQASYENEMNKQKERDIREVEDYLKSKKINSVKTTAGAFVEILRKGEGPLPDSGKQVFLKYTGKNFKGEAFDSNVDPAFGHTDTFKIIIGQMGSIQGFEEGVRQLAKGGKARIYIPSMLGYGMQGAPPKIKPYEHLIFEVDLLDIQLAKAVIPAIPPSGIDQTKK
jgi:FKBP-type peptidyl-prolyl cis-trans isomerase FkpA